MKHPIRYTALYILLRIFQGIVIILPLGLVRYVGIAFGILAFIILPRQVRKVKENLAFAFKDEMDKAQITKITSELFKNLGQNLAEILYIPRLNNKNIDKLIKQEGIEKIDKALKAGKGAIILSAHIGNWELLPAYFGLKGYPGTVIARRLRVELFDDLLSDLRRAKNIDMLYREDAFKNAVSVLKSNRCLGILPDQDMDAVEGIFVDFFGEPAYTPVGPVNLALVTGAPIIPCYIIRNGKGHKVIVEDPIELTITQDRKSDIIENTAKWSRVTEKYIKRYPSQWVWMHSRWKTRPLTTEAQSHREL